MISFATLSVSTMPLLLPPSFISSASFSFAAIFTPSLGLTDISISESEDKKLLAIGASEFRELAPLPLVGQELSKIGGTKNKEIIFNKEFTPESFFEKAIQEKYDMIHIATHAEFKPGGPNASRLFSGTTPITLDNFSILRKGRIGNPLDFHDIFEQGRMMT